MSNRKKDLKITKVVFMPLSERGQRLAQRLKEALARLRP